MVLQAGLSLMLLIFGAVFAFSVWEGGAGVAEVELMDSVKIARRENQMIRFCALLHNQD